MGQTLHVQKQISIREMEALTGVKMATLRVWERRYKMLYPERKLSGVRMYPVEELGKILDLVLLVNAGHRVSQVMTTGNSIPKTIGNERQDLIYLKALHQLILYMYQFNHEFFSDCIDNLLDKYPSTEVMDHVLIPFLRRTRLLWKNNGLPEEHLVVPIIRSKFINCIEKNNSICYAGASKVILFLQGGSQSDLLLLYTWFRLKLAGLKVIYLGTDVSLSSLREIINKMKPSFLFTYIPARYNFDENLLQQSVVGGGISPELISLRLQNISSESDSEPGLWQTYERAVNRLEVYLTSKS